MAAGLKGKDSVDKYDIGPPGEDIELVHEGFDFLYEGIVCEEL